MTIDAISNEPLLPAKIAREPLVLARWIKSAFLLIVVFLTVRVSLKPTNNLDYLNDQNGMLKILHGQNPYLEGTFIEPPWSAYLLFPIVFQPLETWLALDVALFVAMAFDLGKPSSLLLLAHPIFFFLLASSNPEWLFVGPGLWLLYRAKYGWRRGLAWLFMACKPQTMAFLLIFDGWRAFRQRDWPAFGMAGGVAALTLLANPHIFSIVGSALAYWSSSVLPSYGLLFTIGATVVLLLLRTGRWRDRRTLGILLAPIWSPYFLEYSAVAVIFTLRGAGWIRTILFMIGSFGIGYLFLRQFHVAEAAGILGITLLASLLAPTYK